MKKTTSPRAKKLDAIALTLMMFALNSTYTDEDKAQEYLNLAIDSLTRASKLLAESDKRAADTEGEGHAT